MQVLSLQGSSTHNERVEHLWHDVYRCVGVLYHDTFAALEEESQLDPLNEVDLFCFHYVFLPRVQQTLDSFASIMYFFHEFSRHWTHLLSHGTIIVFQWRITLHQISYSSGEQFNII